MNAPYRLLIAVVLLCAAPQLVHADPDDPFDPANKAPELGPQTRELMTVVSVAAQATPDKVKRGEVIRVTLTGKPAKGYHAYSITQKTPKQGEATPTINYSGVEGLRPLWPIDESPPEWGLDPLGNIALHHDQTFTWAQDLLVDAGAKPGKYELTITLKSFQVCNENRCVGPADFRPLYVNLEILDADPVTPTKAITDRLQGPPAIKLATPPQDVIDRLKSAPNPGKTDVGGKTGVDFNDFWSFLPFAALSAFLMLLTPCVFPMIPITVNFFLKQSEKEHHNPLAMASVYSGTIIVLLTTIMLVFGSVIIEIADNRWFNLGLGAVLIFFALSLFGMYEIELPHFLSRFTSEREGKGGLIGTVFMAITFTITSFTCTGPFLGLMLGSVASVKPPMPNLIAAAVVYSTTFAAPFFVLALFPSMIKKLPKSGSWLNNVKVTMGFLELGAALKFLSNADFAFFPGNPQVFNYDTVLASWIALSISCSLYLLGLFRLPHDDKVENIGVIRMLTAVAFLVLAIYLAPAMFGLHPAGVVGDNAIAFLPIRTGHEADGPALGGGGGGSSGHQDFYLEYEEGWKDAVKNNKLVFIDFTGVNCTNCRYNESNVFPLPDVQRELKNFVKIALYTDSVPKPGLASNDAIAQGARNLKWQQALTKKDVSRPYYVVFKPAPDKAFEEDGVPKGAVLGIANGTIKTGADYDVPTFVRILRDAQAPQTAQLQAPPK
jgi:thiol:disulfide interchange protein DsbD